LEEITSKKFDSIIWIKPDTKHVHIRDIRDGWIMQKFGDELQKLKSNYIKFTFSKEPNYAADINYYINWTNDNPRLDKIKKSKCDIILFTHFESEHFHEENAVIKWADYFTCMSQHGKEELIKRGINSNKIGIIEGIGVSVKRQRKIVIGWSGRPYYHLKRKCVDILVKLARDLDEKIFKFVIKNKNNESNKLIQQMRDFNADLEVVHITDDTFFDKLDYYLSSSNAEGGPMDLLNAMYAGVPVIARDIGFFHTLRTSEDFLFYNYEDLLRFLKEKEKIRKDKYKLLEPYTWTNFRSWHIDFFKQILKELQ